MHAEGRVNSICYIFIGLRRIITFSMVYTGTQLHGCKEIITSRQIDGGKWEPKIKETRKENSQGLTRVGLRRIITFSMVYTGTQLHGLILGYFPFSSLLFWAL
jgi:hypothetical protein